MKVVWAGTGWSTLGRGLPWLLGEKTRKGDEGGRVMSGHEALNVRGEGRLGGDGWFLERKMGREKEGRGRGRSRLEFRL